jgi:outer membrane protein assembly factor BamD (BamD/ComL family)
MSGCSSVAYLAAPRDQQLSADIEHTYRQGAYQQSLAHCEALIHDFPGSPFYAQALLYAGLNSLQLHYLDDDYRSALRYFEQVKEKVPDSPQADQAQAWIAVLSRALQVKQDLLNAEALNARFRQSLDEKDRRLVKLKTESEKLKKEIELLKKVDLQMHQQKRDMSNAGR